MVREKEIADDLVTQPESGCLLTITSVWLISTPTPLLINVTTLCTMTVQHSIETVTYYCTIQFIFNSQITQNSYILSCYHLGALIIVNNNNIYLKVNIYTWN